MYALRAVYCQGYAWGVCKQWPRGGSCQQVFFHGQNSVKRDTSFSHSDVQLVGNRSILETLICTVIKSGLLWWGKNVTSLDVIWISGEKLELQVSSPSLRNPKVPNVLAAHSDDRIQVCTIGYCWEKKLQVEDSYGKVYPSTIPLRVWLDPLQTNWRRTNF